MAPPSIRSWLDRAVKVIEMENTADQIQIDLLAKTGMLVEALPFMRQYSNKTILIKFGGHAMAAAGLQHPRSMCSVAVSEHRECAVSAHREPVWVVMGAEV